MSRDIEYFKRLYFYLCNINVETLAETFHIYDYAE